MEKRIGLFTLIGIGGIIVGIVWGVLGLDVGCWIFISIGVISLIIGFALSIKQVNMNEKIEEEKRKERELLINQEIQDYKDWINQNYKVSKFIAFHESSIFWNKNSVVAVDEENKVIIFGRKVIKFEEILGAELKTHTSQNITSQTEKNNPLGRAIIGGVVAGGVGAIVGASTAKETSVSNSLEWTKVIGVTIHLSNISQPRFEYSSSRPYENEEVYSTLIAIMANNKNINSKV